MKTIRNIALSSLLFISLLPACSRLENADTCTDGSTIELASVSTDPLTKAVIEGSSFTVQEASAGIGLFLMDGSSLYSTSSFNVQYTFSESKWTATSPLRVGSREGTLYGYYPYSWDASDIKAVPVVSSLNGNDYLYAQPQTVSSSGAKTVQMTMNHALARLSLTIKKEASYQGSGVLSAITVTGDGIAASGTLDATTGGITAVKADFKATSLNETVTTSGITEDCLIVPAYESDQPQDLTLFLTIDGIKLRAELTGGNAVKVQQGVRTDISITLKNGAIVVDETSVGLWLDGDEQTISVGDQFVTIKLAEDVIPGDILMYHSFENDGSTLLINAYCRTGVILKCTLGGNEITPALHSDIQTFTVENLTEDCEAVIGYSGNGLDAKFYRYCLANFDIDGDGIFVKEEAANVTEVKAPAGTISLDALKDFTNLTKLDASGCTSLVSIDLSNSPYVTQIDLTGCTSLAKFDYHDETLPALTTSFTFGQNIVINGIPCVVCHCSPDKIMTISTNAFDWDHDKSVYKLCGATSSDGRVNTEKIIATLGTSANAARWCTGLGPGWYMAAIEEAEETYILANRNAQLMLGSMYSTIWKRWVWTSSEDPEDSNNAYNFLLKSEFSDASNEKSYAFHVMAMKYL